MCKNQAVHWALRVDNSCSAKLCKSRHHDEKHEGYDQQDAYVREIDPGLFIFPFPFLIPRPLTFPIRIEFRFRDWTRVQFRHCCGRQNFCQYVRRFVVGCIARSVGRQLNNGAGISRRKIASSVRWSGQSGFGLGGRRACGGSGWVNGWFVSRCLGLRWYCCFCRLRVSGGGGGRRRRRQSCCDCAR
jgi:hypothetical protein